MNYFNRMCEVTEYSPITTLWSDFTNIDQFQDTNKIKEFYNTTFKQYKNSYKEFTEFVMVLNWKSWYHHDNGLGELSDFYADLFYLAYQYGLENFTGDELTYFWRTLD